MNFNNILTKYQTKQSIKSANEELTKRFSATTKDACYGMYVGVPNDPSIKENRNIILSSIATTDYNDVHYFDTKKVYKRDAYSKEHVLIAHKGDKKVRKMLNRYDRVESLKAMWMIAGPQFSQVAYGVTKYRREAFIIDSDVHYSSLQQAKSLMIDFCNTYSLPFLSYLLRNTTSGHIQAGWFTTEPYIGQEAFKYHSETIRNLAQLYEEFCIGRGITDPKVGDIGFHGPSCKNPFWAGFDAEVYDNSVDKDSFSAICNDHINGLSSYYASRKTINENNNKNNAELQYNNISFSSLSYNIEIEQSNNQSSILPSRKLTIVNNSRQKHKFINGSRDAYRCKALREWLWKNGMPDVDTAKDYYINTIMPAAAEATKKPLESWKEVKSAFFGTYNWAKAKYNPCNQQAKNASKLTALGSFTRTVNSFVEHIDGLSQILNNEKITRRTLAKKLDMTVSQVQSMYYRKGEVSIEYFTERLNAVEAYLNKVRSNDSKTRVVAAALACYHECLMLIQQKKDYKDNNNAELQYNNISFSSLSYNIEIEQSNNQSESNNESKIKTTYYDTVEKKTLPITSAIPMDYLEQLHNGDSYKRLKANLDANYIDDSVANLF